MIKYKGLEFTREEIEASIETIKKSIKPIRELVLESLEVSGGHARNVVKAEDRIEELKALLNG